jgi:hypothetical protein
MNICIVWNEFTSYESQVVQILHGFFYIQELIG